MRRSVLPVLISGVCATLSLSAAIGGESNGAKRKSPYLLVLGIAQDGGVPHAGCTKLCCRDLWGKPDKKKHAAALAVVDPSDGAWWLFEATPDFPAQLAMIKRLAPEVRSVVPQGIFLTHAHIGQYTGLMYLGREAMGTSSVPVYAMPRFKRFLEENGPWSQLVSLRNIALPPLQDETTVLLNPRVSVTPFLVPHRDELSETVGFRIRGPAKDVVFIPDIDKWNKWQRDIREIVRESDLLFVDGSFFRNGEISGRDMKEIPHPFIDESMELFSGLSPQDRNKLHFIHLNHTNPAIDDSSPAREAIRKAGFHVAAEGWRFEM